MNICFIANYNKTQFFFEIAKVLSEKYNINIYWIVVNKSNKKYLETYTNNILYLSKSVILDTKNTAIDDFKVNELVYGDRILKFSTNKGIDFLTKIQKPVYDFIKDNRIQYIFGELTWAHELLIFRISKYCQELKCKFLNPHTIRIPGGRFAFFEDEFQSKIFEFDLNYENKQYPVDTFIPKKPDYLQLNDKILKKKNSLKGRIKRIKKFITSENLNSDDITLPEKWKLNRFFTPFIEEVNKETYKFIQKVDFDSIKQKKFILLTLHKQPEASVDVLGRYMEDQFINITNIWKQLPEDWLLVIKEHTNAIGDRSWKFYNKLIKYKNLVFIDEKTDSYKLLEYCQAVVTVSGTIAYEAALLQKKALVLCEVFFYLSYVKKITLEDFKYTKNILDLLNTIPDNKDDERIKKFIYANSFVGIISDPVSNPKCMEKNNIDNIVKAINIICEKNN
ncbi:hypothetical protein [Apibacter sp. HY039]|uniref:hypothetical protein n=1 Tax=Apibacter sp. HY039 TaxID=2501476 RepID=UPI000FEBE513|nr:hypothetical protein [Apibacter sp. HY039]